MNKKFDMDLLVTYKEKTKMLIIEIMEEALQADFVRENEEEGLSYNEGLWDWEFSKIKNGKMSYRKVETEITNYYWMDDVTGYETIDFPARKLHNSADIFVIISSRLPIAFIISREKLFTNYKLINKPTKYEPDGGDFLRIDTKLGFFVNKVNGKWEIV